MKRTAIEVALVFLVIMLGLMTVDQYKKSSFWHQAFEGQQVFQAMAFSQIQSGVSVENIMGAQTIFFEIAMRDNGHLNATQKLMRAERDLFAQTSTPYTPSPGLFPDRIGLF